MRQLTKLSISESISKRRLVFKESWFDIFDRFMVYLYCACLIIPSVFLDFNFKIKNSNDTFFLWALFIPLPLLGLYTFYRKAAEKRLYVLATPYSKEKNWQMLIDYAEREQLEIYRNAKSCLIFNESTSDWVKRYKRSSVFFIKDQMIMFTVIQDGYRISLPTFTAHLFLRYDMKKLFRSTAK